MRIVKSSSYLLTQSSTPRAMVTSTSESYKSDKRPLSNTLKFGNGHIGRQQHRKSTEGQVGSESPYLHILPPSASLSEAETTLPEISTSLSEIIFSYSLLLRLPDFIPVLTPISPSPAAPFSLPLIKLNKT